MGRWSDAIWWPSVSKQLVKEKKMLKSNVITVTLHGTSYPDARSLLHERAQLLAKIAEDSRTDRSGNSSLDVERV